MLKLLLAASLVVLLSNPCSGGGMLPGRAHDSKYFLLYIYEKAADQCYGPDFMRKFGLEMRELFAKCYTQTSDIATEFSLGKYKRSKYDFQNRFTSNDILKDMEDIHSGSPFYPATVVRALKNDVIRNVRVVACLFDNLGLTVSTQGTVDGSAMVTKYQKDKNIPSSVKEYLLQGIATCQAESASGNFLKWGKKYEDFFKILKFFRCAELQKMLSCMKADLKNSGQDFDLSGLDGELSDVDDVARRLFVASSYASWDHTGLLDH